MFRPKGSSSRCGGAGSISPTEGATFHAGAASKLCRCR